MGKQKLFVMTLLILWVFTFLAGCQSDSPADDEAAAGGLASPVPNTPTAETPLATAAPTVTPAAETPAAPTPTAAAQGESTPQAAAPTGAPAATTPEAEGTPTAGERGSAASIAGLDACELFPPEEAEQALDRPVRPPENLLQAESIFTVTSCFYTAADDSSAYAGMILVAPADGNEEFSRATFEYSRQEAGNLLRREAVDVPELGDAAYWVGGEIRTLFVLQDGIQLHFTQTNAPEDYPSPEMIERIQAILARLP